MEAKPSVAEAWANWEKWASLDVALRDGLLGPPVHPDHAAAARALALAPLHTLRVHLGRLAADEALGDVGWVKRSIFQAIEQIEQQIEALP
jgi:hypothetical protein